MTAAELQAARSALGFTQGALASALGVGRRTVQHWEADERAIPETVAKVLRAAQVDRTIIDRISAA
jgi:transcriptional regulator with XRE-family HTH domain